MSYGKIVLIESIPKLRRMITDHLLNAGMEVISFATVDRFSVSVAYNADVVVLSCEQFSGSISTQISQLRGTRRTPVIAMRSRVSEHSCESLFADGADDVITRPVSIEDIRLKIVKQLEKVRPLDLIPLEDVYEHEGLCVDIKQLKAVCDGEELTMTMKELQLLHLMLSRRDYVFEHGELISRVWGTSNVNHHTLTVHINRIKKKIGAYGTLIRSVRSVGYIFDSKEQDC